MTFKYNRIPDMEMNAISDSFNTAKNIWILEPYRSPEMFIKDKEATAKSANSLMSQAGSDSAYKSLLK